MLYKDLHLHEYIETIPKTIDIEYHNEIWTQSLDYKHVPFKCKICHEYGNLVRYFPFFLVENQENTTQND